MEIALGSRAATATLPVVCGKTSCLPAASLSVLPMPAGSEPRADLAMAAAALTTLIALLAANGTSQLHCACSSIDNMTEDGRVATLHSVTGGQHWLWFYYCTGWGYWLAERCELLEHASTVLPAAARLVPWGWQYGLPPQGVALTCGGGDCDCGAALAAVSGITVDLDGKFLWPFADVLTESCCPEGMNDTIRTAETLAEDHLRHQKLSQLLHVTRRITRALDMVRRYMYKVNKSTGHSKTGLASILKQNSQYWPRIARLLPLLATHLSQLFIPLAYEHMGNHTTGQQLHGWIKKMERVRDMLDTKLRGVVHDAQFLSEQVANYKIEEDKDRPANYKIRRPLLSEGLLKYQESFLSFRDEFGALCEQQMPHVTQVFGLADTMYALYRYYLIRSSTVGKANITVDDEMQMKDQSNTTVWVDTGCLQLLADAVDQPRCPLEELPPEASRQRRQCREQLWRDLVERQPRPPVTSYVAYNERAAVSLCLLAWMAANSRGVCQDVHFSILQSVHDARCFFDSPDNQTCLKSNATDAICSVARDILLFKCHDFSSVNIPNVCLLNFPTTRGYSEVRNITWEKDFVKVYGKATARTLSYKDSLNSATLKYRDFKVDVLKPLEYSFVAVNVLFRMLTASVYMWVPHLGNLPGKILLSFQFTGLAQVVCSEVLYRMVGFPDLSTAVLVDSSLTLLGCLWLNTFCYLMYVCVRDLRLPNHLTPAEASLMFRRQLLWALVPWAVVSVACFALEKSSKYYLMSSRITLIVAISSSVAYNLVVLGLVALMYVCNKKSLRQLEVTGNDKGFSKKQLIFLSVNTIIVSGICVIIRIGFHQAEGLAQYVYYVHIATMLQGPVLFVFFACNGTTLPALRNRLLALCRPDVYRPELELFSTAKQNLARRRGEPPPTAETAL